MKNVVLHDKNQQILSESLHFYNITKQDIKKTTPASRNGLELC